VALRGAVSMEGDRPWSFRARSCRCP